MAYHFSGPLRDETETVKKRNFKKLFRKIYCEIVDYMKKNHYLNLYYKIYKIYDNR